MDPSRFSFCFLCFFRFIAPIGQSKHWGALAALVVGYATCAGCGVAPVIPRKQAPRAPTRTAYASAHGIPRAFGGGVCPLSSPHTHSYPPVPRAAFKSTPDGYKDLRARYAYFDPHPARSGACFIQGWHLHLKPPLPSLRYQKELNAYAAKGETPLQFFPGSHPRRPCDAVKCTETRPHGHLACAQMPSSRPWRKPEQTAPPR